MGCSLEVGAFHGALKIVLKVIPMGFKPMTFRTGI